MPEVPERADIATETGWLGDPKSDWRHSIVNRALVQNAMTIALQNAVTTAQQNERNAQRRIAKLEQELERMRRDQNQNIRETLEVFLRVFAEQTKRSKPRSVLEQVVGPLRDSFEVSDPGLTAEHYAALAGDDDD